MVRLIRLILQFRRRCTIGFLCFLSVLLLIDSDSRLVPCLLLNFLIFKEIIRLVLQIGSLILFAVFLLQQTALLIGSGILMLQRIFIVLKHDLICLEILSSVGRCKFHPLFIGRNHGYRSCRNHRNRRAAEFVADILIPCL